MSSLEADTLSPSSQPRTLRSGLTSAQWAALASAWLGWGFDFFDGLLFNAVAPNCIASLQHLAPGSLAARQAALFWGSVLTSVLLLGWAAGGVLFGWLTDRIGRVRTLTWTIVLYSVGTALCALAPNMTVLVVFRIIAAIGIGGEWAAGAALVAEAVPARRRAEAGAVLFTAAPLGMLLATGVNQYIATVWLRHSPDVAWRYVLACGLAPVLLAAVIRRFVRESTEWKNASSRSAAPRLAELFSPANRHATFSGVLVASAASLTWWTCSALIPVVSTHMAQAAAVRQGLDPVASHVLAEQWKGQATSWFAAGGLLGTLLCALPARRFGRRAMYALYFAASAVAMLGTFGLDWPATTRLALYFVVGIGVFGVAGTFTFYLPELYPTRLRGTGAGFCFNICRVVAAGGPALVGTIASRGADTLAASFRALTMLGFVPLLACLLSPLVVETRDRVPSRP